MSNDIRINATMLESYRYMMKTIEEDDSEEGYKAYINRRDELLSQLRGEPFEANDAMLIGGAFDYLMQHEVQPIDGLVSYEGWLFNADELATARKHIPSMMTHQVKMVSPMMMYRGHKVFISGVFDGLNGNMVIENKTSQRPKALFDYLPSLQWRAYCWLSGLKFCRYNVWHVQANGKYVSVESYKRFDMIMSDYDYVVLKNYVDAFMTFIDTHECIEAMVQRTQQKPFLVEAI